jgi:hypothetical protein
MAVNIHVIVLWVMIVCSVVIGYHVSEDLAASILTLKFLKSV